MITELTHASLKSANTGARLSDTPDPFASCRDYQDPCAAVPYSYYSDRNGHVTVYERSRSAELPQAVSDALHEARKLGLEVSIETFRTTEVSSGDRLRKNPAIFPLKEHSLTLDASGKEVLNLELRYLTEMQSWSRGNYAGTDGVYEGFRLKILEGSSIVSGQELAKQVLGLKASLPLKESLSAERYGSLPRSDLSDPQVMSRRIGDVSGLLMRAEHVNCMSGVGYMTYLGPDGSPISVLIATYKLQRQEGQT